MTQDVATPRFEARHVTRPRIQVEEQLREAILGGTVAQGDKLPSEAELAELFGVSRPTVREALSALVSAGLIRKVPGITGGSFVNTVTPESLGHMMHESMDTVLRLGALQPVELTELCRVLEVPAAGLAARHRNPDQVAALWSIVDRQTTTTIDDPDVASYDLDFHITVGRSSGNRLLAAFIAALHEATHPAQYLELTADVAETAVRQHIAIARAIESGSPDEASAAMVDHLDFVLRFSTDLAKGRP